jgi:hypothetical protein
LLRLPVSAGTKIVWAIASLLFVLVFSVRDRTAAWTFVPANAPVWQALLAAAVFSSFAALCLWQQLRRVFLTSKSQVRVFLVLWLFFAVTYPILGGLLMLAGPDVEWRGPFAGNVAWDLSALTIAAGQLAFLGAMLVSLVWNADEPGFAAIRLNRDVAIAIIAEARTHKTLSGFRMAQLNAALRALEEDAPKLLGKLLNTADAALLEKWWTAAQDLRTTLAPRPTSQFGSFDWRTVAEPLSNLTSEQ